MTKPLDPEVKRLRGLAAGELADEAGAAHAALARIKDFTDLGVHEAHGRVVAGERFLLLGFVHLHVDVGLVVDAGLGDVVLVEAQLELAGGGAAGIFLLTLGRALGGRLGSVTAALQAQLERRLGPGKLFIDVDSIKPGQDFVEEIEKALDSSSVLLVLIGIMSLPVLLIGDKKLTGFNPNQIDEAISALG